MIRPQPRFANAVASPLNVGPMITAIWKRHDCRSTSKPQVLQVLPLNHKTAGGAGA